MPFFIVRKVAGKYVAGENAEDTLKVVNELNQQGYSVTVDILGEHTQDKKTAMDITNQYQSLLRSIHENNLNCNISIKPSHLGMDVSKFCILENMLQLINTAREIGQFIRIDMEDASLTDATLELYDKCKEKYEDVGIVFQAYLYRTQNDLTLYSKTTNFNFRLCKGIYRESEQIAIQGRNNINNNYLKLLRFAFENNIYVGIATHDLLLIQETYKLIKDMNISNDRFEFQVLYGVPMSGWLEKHLENHYKVRIYVPFGKDWYFYSMRRLKENPNIATYIIRDLFRK